MQRGLSLPVDPIELRQKNFLFGRKNKKIRKLEKPLTPEEADRLLTSWRETGFTEFNSWIQIARAQINTEIQENTEGFGRRASKMFSCNLTLRFDEDASLKMVSTGFARSKKDAKRMAIENVVVELIKNGEIVRGLKNELGISQNKLNDSNPRIFQVQKEAINESVQKKIQKLTKKMQESLKYGRFFEACESLSQIVTRKKPDWNEIAFIWSHALLKKDFSHVKAIIDLIQFKKVQPSLNTSVFEELKASEPTKKENQETEEEKAKKELIKKYGNGRLTNDNPYEVLDAFNVGMNLPEIVQDTTKETKEITEEEANAEIVKEPLSVDLNKLFVADSAAGYSLEDLNNMLNQLSNNPSSLANPTATFADPKLLNPSIALELNKLLHQLTFQPLSLNLFGQSIDPNNQNILGSISSLDLTNLINQVSALTQQQQDIIKKDPVDDFKTPSRSYTTEDSLYNRTPQIDLSTSREVKNPSINYLSFKLLNEFYDSLLYVGDLNFALSVAEILYARIRLDDEEFINSFACYYFANKKNMLMIEMIESMYLPLVRNRSKTSDGLCSVEGSVDKIGHKFAQEVILFSPLASQDQVENKVLRRTHTEGKESYGQISEGEFVKLTLCPSPDISKDNLSDGEVSMGFLNQGFFFGQQQQQQQQSTVTNPDSSSLTEYEMIACVREIQKDFRVKLFVLPTKEQSEMLGIRGKTWKISKLTNRTTIDKTSEALETFCTQITMAQPLLQIILSPPICNNNYVQQLAESKVFFHNKPHNLCVTNLNESQQKALNCATTQLLTLIQGPPGTGKTTTAVEIVLEWLRLAPIPILACADSNIAVDRLYEEFKAAGIRCMRIGPGYDEKNDLKSEKSYAMYTALCNAKQYHNANSVKFGIIKKKISEAQVVCATCVGSTSEYLKGITFQRVILDEVTQANEISTLIPLTKGCQQLVLVGDHKQLPPTVLSTFAQSKGMTISLFERLVKQGVVPNLLNVQYRMHSSISQFPSYQFYNNMLENGTNDADRPIFEGFNWPNTSMRVAFVNVRGIEEVYASSIQNSKEVEVVVEILVKLLPFNHINTIGIITPYDAQKKRIRNEVKLQAKKYPKLFGLTQGEADNLTKYSVISDIDTVDGYQGMEREMIIFSAVRSNYAGNLGFLRDPRRLNVTLTRAKRGLIIVGDMSTLMHDQNWKEWIQWCKRNQVVLHYK